jgi:hypothetical protein
LTDMGENHTGHLVPTLKITAVRLTIQ